MRGIGFFFGSFLAALSLAQTLSVPPQGKVGQPLTIRGSDFAPGRYLVQVEGTSGSQTIEAEAQNGSFELTYTPTSEGMVRFQVGSVETQSQISSDAATAAQPTSKPETPSTSSNTPPSPEDQKSSASQPKAADQKTPTQPKTVAQPLLQSDGLVVGGWRLPLVGNWVGPRTSKQKAFIFQGPLVLEIDLTKPAVVAQYYPPAEVRSVETDPEPAAVLQDGRRIVLSSLAGRPYEGKWASLQVIRSYVENLEKNNASQMDQSGANGKPYWYYFALDPNRIAQQDLEIVGKDLLQRGHRPELAWGTGVMTWLQPWLLQLQTARTHGLDAGLAWSEFFIKYLPQLPGATAMFSDQIRWLEAQGRPDLAQRYREGLRQLASWQNPLPSESLSKIAWALAALYLLMLVYLNLVYIPAQVRGTRSSGGWLLGWFQHPLVRLRHTLLAYTTVGERILFSSLFVLVTLSVLAWGFALRSESLTSQDSLTRGTLRSNSAQETLRSLANSAPMRGLLGYALARDNPAEAQRLLESAPNWTYVLLNRGTPDAITRASRQAPGSAAVKDILGTGGDLWTSVYKEAGVAREGVPTTRVISATVTLSGLQAMQSDFLGVWRSLPIWPSELWAWAVAVLILMLTLYHILCFFIPRPKGAAQDLAWRRGVQLFFPGSPSYSQGWGILMLIAFISGIWIWRMGVGAGLILALVALVLHLILWSLWFARPRAA